MNDDRLNDEPGAGRVVAMAVLLAALIVLLSFLLDDPSGEGPAVQPLLSAHAATPQPARDETAGRTVPTSKPDEDWAADESSRGMRPDASH